MKRLFHDIHINSIITFVRQINLFNKILSLFLRFLFCFTYISDHNTDSLMLYSVQVKNMYSYLNWSLKLSDIVRGLSCQQSYCNSISLYKLIIITPFILFNTIFTFSIHIMFSIIPYDAYFLRFIIVCADELYGHQAVDHYM